VCRRGVSMMGLVVALPFVGLGASSSSPSSPSSSLSSNGVTSEEKLGLFVALRGISDAFLPIMVLRFG
jgi:hypothetical protein